MYEQPQPQTEESEGASWRWGLIGGGSIAVVDVLSLVIGNFLDLSGLGGLLWLISFFVLVGAGFGAGKSTGTVRSGAFAGALAAIIAPVAEIVLLVVFVLANLIFAGNAQVDFAFGAVLLALLLGSSLTGAALVILVVGLILRVMLALGIGALGALIGKDFYEDESPQEEPAEYEMADYPARDVYQPTRYYIPGGQYPSQQPGEDGYADFR